MQKKRIDNTIYLTMILIHITLNIISFLCIFDINNHNDTNNKLTVIAY